MSLVTLDTPAPTTTRVDTRDGVATDTAYALVRELVMNAELLPNTHHMESAIADRLRVDQADLHQAALRLQAEGAVTLEPRGGFWVAPFAPQAVIETCRQIGKLEARAAYVASLHGANAVGMATLDDAVLRMEDSLFRNDLMRWAAADHHFHRSLVQCSGVSSLIEAALPLSEPIHRARMVALAVGRDPAEQTQNHALLVEAIRRGSATEARERQLRYWQDTARIMVDLLQRNLMDRM